MKTNLVARVIISISKSQSFMISINKLDYQQMPTSMVPQSCYPVKLGRIIMLIAVTLLASTNFTQIYNCSLRAPNGNVPT